MRLGTLARKTNITPSALTAHVAEQGIDSTKGTNTKLTESQVEAILVHFGKTLPEHEPELVEEPTVESETIPTETIIEAVEEPTHNENSIIEDSINEIGDKEKPQAYRVSDSFSEIALPHELELEEDLVEQELAFAETEKSEQTGDVENIQEIENPIYEAEDVIAEPMEEASSIEEDAAAAALSQAMIDADIESEVEMSAHDESIKVIKPKKVELQGLTIKGKIDLPEPVKKSTEEKPKEPKQPKYDPSKILTTQGPASDRRRKPKNYKGKKFDKGYNPVEAARKKKEWEEKKKKERELKQKKEVKKNYYKTKATILATPSVKKKEKKYVVKKAKPKFEGNTLQRFWQWMNT